MQRIAEKMKRELTHCVVICPLIDIQLHASL